MRRYSNVRGGVAKILGLRGGLGGIEALHVGATVATVAGDVGAEELATDDEVADRVRTDVKDAAHLP
jgi:hypothetical protein